MTESCPRCDGVRIHVVVPDELRAHAASSTLACCVRCLAADPVESEAVRGVPAESTPNDATAEPAASTWSESQTIEANDATAEPSVERICRRFPTGDGGVGLVVLLQQLDSLALNRPAIESVVGYLETQGVDLFLTLDRLLDAPDVDPYFDLARRRDQLAQLLDW